MQTVTVESVVTGWCVRDVYERLKDTEVYTKYAPEQVKSVVSESTGRPDEVVTHWEIYFRKGLLCWSERDFYDDEDCTLRFEQTDGDFDVFEGSWAISEEEQEGGGTRVMLRFDATFDFGVPSLEAIIDPVAIRVLRQSMSLIISSLFGGSLIDREPTKG